MKTELLSLVYVTALTGLLWVPHILDRIAKRGLTTAVGYLGTHARVRGRVLRSGGDRLADHRALKDSTPKTGTYPIYSRLFPVRENVVRP